MKDDGTMFEVRNLSSAYGQSEVLHGIDLAVKPGEIVALVGRNGAKSMRNSKRGKNGAKSFPAARPWMISH